MKLLTDLMLKCWNNNLSIDINPHNYGSVAIWDFRKIKEKKANYHITEGSLKNWIDETPEDTLNRMHKEVDEYLAESEVDESIGEETEHAQADLTEYERKMKEAGHKEGDFA